MGSQASLIYRLDYEGSVPAATLAAKMGAVPIPPDVLGEFALRVITDFQAVSPIQRGIVLSFLPTANGVATPHLVPGDPSGAPINHIDVLTPGVDYIRPPVVLIDPPPNDVEPPSRAVAKAYLKVVGNAVVNGGTGYVTTGLHVAFVGGLPPADANQDVLPFAVNSLKIAKRGRGYSLNTPVLVQFKGALAAGGHHATAVLSLNAQGGVDTVTVTDPGSGYKTIPTAFVYDPQALPPAISQTVGTFDNENAAELVVQPGMGTPATGTAFLAGTTIAGISLATNGSGYVKVPSVVITGGGGSGAIVTASMGVDTPLKLLWGGKGYLATSPPVVHLIPLFISLFPNLTAGGVDAKTLASQAGPFFNLMTAALQRATLSPVRADPPAVS